MHPEKRLHPKIAKICDLILPDNVLIAALLVALVTISKCALLPSIAQLVLKLDRKCRSYFKVKSFKSHSKNQSISITYQVIKCCCCSSFSFEAYGFALHPSDQADIVEELEEGALPEDD